MSSIGNWLQLRYRQVKKKAEGPNQSDLQTESSLTDKLTDQLTDKQKDLLTDCPID